MSFLQGCDRQQSLLLPDQVDDYIGGEHPARFIDAFVEGLDLRHCGFSRVEPAQTGRPPFAPSDLLKLYIWGYLNKVRSSRGLERECKRNLEVIWLLRKLTPDFKTIADFRKDNCKAFKAVFRQFLILCGELKLLGREVAAIDGTKLKAVNNPARNFTADELKKRLERLDGAIKDYLRQLDEADAKESQGPADRPLSTTELKAKIEALKGRQQFWQEQLGQMEERGDRELSLTDPDSRRMRKVGVGYNAQIATESQNKLIVAQEVVNEANDLHQLAALATQASENLGVEQLKVVADGGYHEQRQLAQCEQAGLEAYVPRPTAKGTPARDGRMPKEVFAYDAQSDTYCCPEGEVLSQEGCWPKNGLMRFGYANPGACRGCARKAECTSGDYRRIYRVEHEAVIERVEARVKADPALMAKRKALVEHPFGTMMFWMEGRHLLLRGFEKVRAEFSLMTLVYNLKRVLSLKSMPELLEALG